MGGRNNDPATANVRQDGGCRTASAGFISLEDQLVRVVGQLQSAGKEIEATTSQIVSSSARHEKGELAVESLA